MHQPQTSSPKPAKTTACSACGHHFSVEDNFCGRCGQVVAQSWPKTKHLRTQQQLGRRYVSALFSDIVHSTHLVRDLDPEHFERILKLYQSACIQVIGDFGGQVIEDLGDGIVALFTGSENATESAVRAGHELVKSIAELRAFESRSGTLKLEIRVGISSGEALVIHDPNNQSKRILGQPPYLAARLQSLANKDQVLVCPKTYDKTKGLFSFSRYPKKQLKIKGFADIQDIWRVNKPNETLFRYDASERIKLAPLVGREEIMSTLLKRWEQTSQRQGQLVIIRGAPGIGKSRVLAELQRRVQRHTPDVTLLRYQCSTFARESPLFPVLMQITRLSLIKKQDSAEIITQKFNSLLETWGVKSSNYSDILLPFVHQICRRVAQRKFTPKEVSLAIRACAQIPLLLARQAPVLVVIEDMHWADTASQKLLEASIKNIARNRLMIVVSYRSNQGSIPEYDQHYVSDYLLNRLTDKSAAKLLDSINIGTPLPDTIKQNILKKCGGIPLFLEELTLSAVRETNASDNDTHLKTPASLFDLLIHRFDQFSPSVKSFAQIASVIGFEFDLETVASISNLSDDECRQAISQLSDEEQVFPLEQDSIYYQFKHALIRDAIYDNTLNQDKHRLHTAVYKHLSKVETTDTMIIHNRVSHHKKMMSYYAAFA